MSGLGAVRPPAVAGRFYPGDPRELAVAVRELYADLGPAAPEKAVGALAPHAGYVYSGQTAARVYAACAIPRVCVILCPNHTGRGERFAIQTSGSWDTPMGRVPIDEETAQAILRASPLLQEDTRAHQYEHAIEVHLPLLLARRPDLRFVPICVGGLRPEDLTALGRGMAAALVALAPRPFLLISSDMTHYEPAATASRKDRLAIGMMEHLDPQGLYDIVHAEGISMCGIAPATAALTCLRALGATHGHLVDYTTSGDRSGDYDEVVGYAGLTFHGSPTESLEAPPCPS